MILFGFLVELLTRLPDIDLPPLDHLREELARYRPPDPFDHGDCVYVFPSTFKETGIESLTTIPPHPQKALIGVTIWEFSNLTPGQSAFVARVQDIAPALFAVPFVTNVVITGLIIWRIKQAQDTTKFTSNHKLYAFYRRMIRNTIESCVLYPFFLMVTLILYCLQNNGQDIVSGSFWMSRSSSPSSSHVAFFFSFLHSLPVQWPKSYPSFRH